MLQDFVAPFAPALANKTRPCSQIVSPSRSRSLAGSLACSLSSPRLSGGAVLAAAAAANLRELFRSFAFKSRARARTRATRAHFNCSPASPRQLNRAPVGSGSLAAILQIVSNVHAGRQVAVDRCACPWPHAGPLLQRPGGKRGGRKVAPPSLTADRSGGGGGSSRAVKLPRLYDDAPTRVPRPPHSRATPHRRTFTWATKAGRPAWAPGCRRKTTRSPPPEWPKQTPQPNVSPLVVVAPSSPPPPFRVAGFRVAPRALDGQICRSACTLPTGLELGTFGQQSVPSVPQPQPRPPHIEYVQGVANDARRSCAGAACAQSHKRHQLRHAYLKWAGPRAIVGRLLAPAPPLAGHHQNNERAPLAKRSFVSAYNWTSSFVVRAALIPHPAGWLRTIRGSGCRGRR